MKISTTDNYLPYSIGDLHWDVGEPTISRKNPPKLGHLDSLMLLV